MRGRVRSLELIARECYAAMARCGAAMRREHASKDADAVALSDNSMLLTLFHYYFCHCHPLRQRKCVCARWDYMLLTGGGGYNTLRVGHGDVNGLPRSFLDITAFSIPMRKEFLYKRYARVRGISRRGATDAAARVHTGALLKFEVRCAQRVETDASLKSKYS